MTSEGGASVTYPVMTLAFNIHPSVARDFSFMIQSCGMTAAAFAILYMVSESRQDFLVSHNRFNYSRKFLFNHFCQVTTPVKEAVKGIHIDIHSYQWSEKPLP
jgi:hypothetical protein